MDEMLLNNIYTVECLWLLPRDTFELGSVVYDVETGSYYLVERDGYRMLTDESRIELITKLITNSYSACSESKPSSKCAYCGCTNDHIYGTCDYCGAPLEE